MPVFQNVTYASASEAAAAPLGDVELVQDVNSGLVFNRCFDPELLNYDSAYQNEQSYSDVFKNHLSSALSILQRHYRSGDSVVEIGCGKGFFLEMMDVAGMTPTGFDPAYEGKNPRVQKRCFEPCESADSDLLVLRHVLEHIPKPFDFLSKLSADARAASRIYIEVPCFDWIVRHRAFYDVFYEHCNYFTLEVLSNAFGRVREAGFLFGGQYLYLVADLASFRFPARTAAMFASLDFSADVETWASRASGSLPPFVWGAGAKGMTFSNLLFKQGVAVAGLVDVNPAKQGRYAGLSALPIYAPASIATLIAAGHPIQVMNPNYLTEIVRTFPDVPLNYACVA